MGKFDDAFENLGSGSGGAESAETKAQRLLQNKEHVEAFGAQKAKSRVGYISGIVDLGLQSLDDAKVKSELTPEQEEEAIAAAEAKGQHVYFEDGLDDSKKPVRFKRWPQKEQPAIAITVDFPQHPLDWGGEIGVKPARFVLNGEFIPKGKKPWDVVVGRVYSLKETTKDFDPAWSLAKNSMPYKLAVATEVITDDQPFTKKMLGKLIGKPALFQVEMTLKDGYKQESIKFAGVIPEGLPIPEANEDDFFFINLTAENELVHVKQLRQSIKNTIKRSTSYQGSKLQEQYDDILFPPYNGAARNTGNDDVDDADDSDSAPVVQEKPAKAKSTAKPKAAPAPEPEPVEYDEDEPLPF